MKDWLKGLFWVLLLAGAALAACHLTPTRAAPEPERKGSYWDCYGVTRNGEVCYVDPVTAAKRMREERR